MASGQFSTWVVSSGGAWYVGQIKAADGTASYSDNVALNVPVANGYQVYVYYRATTGDPWGLYGMSPGTVANVTAAAFNAITVTAPPSGTTSRAQGANLAVAWTTNAAVASGQFSTWVVSSGGAWYVGQIKAADGTASYSDNVALNVPVANGYQVYVYYRATTGDPLGPLRHEPGDGQRDGGRLQRHHRHRPAQRHHAQGPGRHLPVGWTTNAALASGGEFTIWVVRHRRRLVRRQTMRRGRHRQLLGTTWPSTCPSGTATGLGRLPATTGRDAWGVRQSPGTGQGHRGRFYAITVPRPAAPRAGPRAPTWRSAGRPTPRWPAAASSAIWVADTGGGWYFGRRWPPTAPPATRHHVALNVPLGNGY